MASPNRRLKNVKTGECFKNSVQKVCGLDKEAVFMFLDSMQGSRHCTQSTALVNVQTGKKILVELDKNTVVEIVKV